MRRTLAVTLLAATALFATPFAASASGICGGGEPGEPCYCPNTVKIKDKEITLFYC